MEKPLKDQRRLGLNDGVQRPKRTKHVSAHDTPIFMHPLWL